jgi:hypothetical protein
MMQQNYVLPHRIKIDAENDKANANGHFGFYAKYSRFILKALKKSSFQDFLQFMFLAENIEEKIVDTVEIRVLPAPRKNGFNLVGKCDTFRGRIRIYPKSFNYCNAFSKKYGRDCLFAFVGNRAKAALMHELLHLKYVGDEKKVRELTASYFSEYLKKQLNKNFNWISMNDLIFSSKKHTPFRGQSS